MSVIYEPRGSVGITLRRLAIIVLVSLSLYAPLSAVMGFVEGSSHTPLVNSGDCRIVNVLVLARKDGKLVYSMAYTPETGEQRHVFGVLPGSPGRLDSTCPSCAVYDQQGVVEISAGKITGVKITTSDAWEAFHFLSAVAHAQGVLFAARF
jgi:hypothetical protein